MGNKGKPSYLSALVKLYILHWSHLGCKLWKGEKNKNNFYCGPRLKRARRRARIGSLALNDFWVISSRSVQWGGSWLRLGVEYSPCLCSSVKVCSNSLSMWSLEVRRAKSILDLLHEASPPPQRNKKKQQHSNTNCLKAWVHTHTWRCTRILSGRSHTRNWLQTEGRPAPSSPASASHRTRRHPASLPPAAAGRIARSRCWPDSLRKKAWARNAF